MRSSGAATPTGSVGAAATASGRIGSKAAMQTYKSKGVLQDVAKVGAVQPERGSTLTVQPLYRRTAGLQDC